MFADNEPWAEEEKDEEALRGSVLAVSLSYLVVSKPQAGRLSFNAALLQQQ